MDLATENRGFDNGISVLIGNGDWSFQPEQRIPINGFVGNLHPGDVNSDGITDLVATIDPTEAIDQLTEFLILLGSGEGGFCQRAFEAGGEPWSLRVIDLNDDNFLDIAASGLVAENEISIFLGNGDGTFQARQTYEAGENPVFLQMTDVSEDGALDILIANLVRDSSDQISVLLGKGDGSFGPPQPVFFVGPELTFASSGHLNDDGRIDLVIGASSRENFINRFEDVSVLFGDSTDLFTVVETFRFRGEGRAVKIADLNHDKFGDLLVINGTEFLRVFLGHGDGTFLGRRDRDGFLDGDGKYFFKVGYPSESFEVADLNADDFLDVMITTSGFNNNYVLILTGTGDGRFQQNSAGTFWQRRYSVGGTYRSGPKTPVTSCVE
ncbi:MAG: VCBS repeat-containing protein [Planctomycetes bacterium]|nr:VCBS repeat-containing protein [Planctomycetota bacterium]